MESAKKNLNAHDVKIESLLEKGADPAKALLVTLGILNNLHIKHDAKAFFKELALILIDKIDNLELFDVTVTNEMNIYISTKWSNHTSIHSASVGSRIYDLVTDLDIAKNLVKKSIIFAPDSASIYRALEREDQALMELFLNNGVDINIGKIIFPTDHFVNLKLALDAQNRLEAQISAKKIQYVLEKIKEDLPLLDWKENVEPIYLRIQEVAAQLVDAYHNKKDITIQPILNTLDEIKAVIDLNVELKSLVTKHSILYSSLDQSIGHKSLLHSVIKKLDESTVEQYKMYKNIFDMLLDKNINLESKFKDLRDKNKKDNYVDLAPNYDIAKVLINKGLKPSKDSKALIKAAWEGDIEFMKLLTDNGVDINGIIGQKAIIEIFQKLKQSYPSFYSRRCCFKETLTEAEIKEKQKEFNDNNIQYQNKLTHAFKWLVDLDVDLNFKVEINGLFLKYTHGKTDILTNYSQMKETAQILKDKGIEFTWYVTSANFLLKHNLSPKLIKILKNNEKIDFTLKSKKIKTTYYQVEIEKILRDNGVKFILKHDNTQILLDRPPSEEITQILKDKGIEFTRHPTQTLLDHAPNPEIAKIVNDYGIEFSMHYSALINAFHNANDYLFNLVLSKKSIDFSNARWKNFIQEVVKSFEILDKFPDEYIKQTHNIVNMILERGGYKHAQDYLVDPKAFVSQLEECLKDKPKCLKYYKNIWKKTKHKLLQQSKDLLLKNFEGTLSDESRKCLIKKFSKVLSKTKLPQKDQLKLIEKVADSLDPQNIFNSNPGIQVVKNFIIQSRVTNPDITQEEKQEYENFIQRIDEIPSGYESMDTSISGEALL